jgi:hypothetical protein
MICEIDLSLRTGIHDVLFNRPICTFVFGSAQVIEHYDCQEADDGNYHEKLKDRESLPRHGG